MRYCAGVTKAFMVMVSAVQHVEYVRMQLVKAYAQVEKFLTLSSVSAILDTTCTKNPVCYVDKAIIHLQVPRFIWCVEYLCFGMEALVGNSYYC